MKGNDLDLQTEDNNNNNNMGDIKADETTSSTTGDLMVVTEDAAWGTYEELLLACAVNRHGTNTWDSIANELHIRRRFHNHFYFSPETCRRKYVDLKHRFTAAANADDGGDGDSGRLRIVEELRKLRVQQLKREVYNHDVSIVSLENKVKILEGGEKEKKNSSSSSSLLAEPDKNEPNSEPSDLRIEPDKNANKTDEPERSSPEKVPGGDSAEDRSVNESNSNNVTDAKREPDPAQKKGMSRLGDTASESKRDNSISNNNNDNNNDDKKRKGEQSSEVQSSASLSKKKRRRKSSSGDGDEIEGEEVSPANKRISVKSQPLIRFFDSLLSHKHASVFHRRLPSQETEKYRNVVRQHMDLDMVQSRLDRGFYCECHPKFYRDLLLIFTNAVLFYRKSSAEHITARELRRLVMEEITLKTHKPKILPTKPDLETQHLEPVVKKPRSSTTMVVCRRRTSLQGLSETMRKKEESHNNVTATSGSIKNSNITNSNIGDGHEEKPKGNHYQNQKKVDGGGSSSNSNALDGVANSKKLVTQEREGERERSALGRGTTLRLSNNNNKKVISKDGTKREKMEDVNKKEESSKVNVDQKQDKTTTTTVLKKQGVANFLKRINQNSPSSQEKASNNNDSDDEEEDDGEKLEVRRKAKMDNSNGKKTVGYARKNSTTNKEVDLIAPRRISGRKGEKEVATSSRATDRPPKRKAAMIGGGTPDSGKGRKSGSDKSRKKPRR